MYEETLPASWQAPSGPGIRLDTHCYQGYVIPPFYDSMIAKLIVLAKDRTAAVAALAGLFALFPGLDGLCRWLTRYYHPRAKE